MKKYAVFFLCFLLLSRAVFSLDWSQALSGVDSDLQQLENLINDTLQNTLEQQRLLEDLRTSLNESGNLIAAYENIISGQENLLKELQMHLNEMSEIYMTQSALSQKYERSSRFWRIFTLIAIPVTAIISGSIVWAVFY